MRRRRVTTLHCMRRSKFDQVEFAEVCGLIEALKPVHSEKSGLFGGQGRNRIADTRIFSRAESLEFDQNTLYSLRHAKQRQSVATLIERC